LIVFDTDILSYFARVGRLQLLIDLFGAPLRLSPNVHRELQAGFVAGHRNLLPALEGLQTNILAVLKLVDVERARMPQVGIPLDKGETDSLAYCLVHDAMFVTNDKRAFERGKRLGVICVRLPAVLRLLWMRGLLSQDGVRALVAEMESTLNMMVGDQDEIFG